MHNLLIRSLFIFCAAFFFSCHPSPDNAELSVRITNPESSDMKDISIEVLINKEQADNLNANTASLGATVEGIKTPVQWVKSKEEGDGKLYFNLDIPADKQIIVKIASTKLSDSLNFIKRSHAELWCKSGGEFVDSKYVGGDEFKPVSSLRVPDECTDHSYYMKYEGPGWESDKVGYRLYLDWRNAIDIFGKKTTTMVLPEVGQDGYDSYHEMADWGADILKVGSSLGIGSIGFWDGEKANRVAKTDSVFCAISEDGLVYSEVKIDYFGWAINATQVDLNTSLSITAGSRATKCTIKLSHELPNICTGIVKLDGGELITGSNSEGWNYLSTWGKQTLFDDMLGMAILYNQSEPVEITEDDLSHVVVLSPANNQVEYYFLAAWEQESDGIKTKQEFVEYLDAQINRLNTPVEVSIDKE